jgi:hypothetical protein
MKKQLIITVLFFTLLSPVFAQDESSDDDAALLGNGKGFHIGLYVGSYFANKYTAKVYDGYGFDFDGHRNNFENSFMYNKIILQYGGYNPGQPDLIAQALNVNHGDWTFDESDMPVNMKYQPAFNIGLQNRYSADNHDVILLNVNAVQLNITGNFTIFTPAPSNVNQYYKGIQTFGIKGVEQRLIFQLGYQRIFGQSDKLNCFVEGGLNITVTKFSKDQILINNMLIDLVQPYNQAGFAPYNVKKPIGTGFGAFAGLGVNLNMSVKWRIQFVYNPSYEGINIGENPKLKLQNGIGLRAYYNL